MKMIREFGPNNLKNSSLCFGTMQFGDGANEKDSQEMYEACRDRGINFFDTAFVYTGGKSELILGKLIKEERDKIILITKAGLGTWLTKVCIITASYVCSSTITSDIASICLNSR